MNTKRIKLGARKKWLWLKEVILAHHKIKLNPYHKMRAIRYGFSSDLYSLYHLEKNNPKDYISEYMRLYSREINGDYKAIMDNKIIFTEFFGRFVPVPKIKFIIRSNVRDLSNHVVSDEKFSKELEKGKLIVKPIDDGGGHGVHMLEKQGDKYLIDYKETAKEDFFENLKSYKNSIVTEVVEQAKYASDIYPKTVNTLRIITLRDPETDEIIIPCAAHRFGSSKTGAVDNVSSGGYVTLIDIDNGKMKKARTYYDDTLISKHPDTNAKIEGVAVPGWKDICKSLISAHEKIAYVPFIAWDVVITKDGFSILETNASSGLSLFQFFGSLRGTKLWEFYKHYGICK